MGRKAPGGLRSYQEESGKTPSADATEERESSTAVHLSGRGGDRSFSGTRKTSTEMSRLAINSAGF